MFAFDDFAVWHAPRQDYANVSVEEKMASSAEGGAAAAANTCVIRFAEKCLEEVTCTDKERERQRESSARV